jgi:uncharacterized protein YjbI with pentapeptide repeats
MTNASQDLASLISKIDQLSERQNITAKYAVGVKRELDELIKKFNNLQQRFEQQSSLSNNLNGAKPANELVSNTAAAVVSRYDGIESIMLNNSTDVMQVIPVEVNADVDEIDAEEINAASQHEQSLTAFSDEEFKIARMTQLLGGYGDMLLLKAYLAEEKSQNLPISAEEFQRRLHKNEKNFTGFNLAGANLSGLSLETVNLSQVNLSGAKLTRIHGSNLNLSGANLKGADFNEAELFSANLSEANLDEAYLYQAKLGKANLKKATLKKVDLRGADLNAADLARQI